MSSDLFVLPHFGTFGVGRVKGSLARNSFHLAARVARLRNELRSTAPGLDVASVVVRQAIIIVRLLVGFDVDLVDHLIQWPRLIVHLIKVASRSIRNTRRFIVGRLGRWLVAVGGLRGRRIHLVGFLGSPLASIC